MDRATYIKLAYQKAMGEANAPSSDTESYRLLVNLGDTLTEEWQNAVDEAGLPINWNSLWAKTTVGIVTATDTFLVNRTLIRKLSTENNGVCLKKADGQYRSYTVVTPRQLKSTANSVALVGNNLIFSKSFEASDPFIGSTIEISYYGYALKMPNDASLVSVDQPMWLVYMAAAELARNDYIKQSEYPNLINLANQVMQSMIAANAENQPHYITHGSWSPLAETF